MPGQPRWQSDLSVEYQWTPKLSSNININVTDGQYFRGDEANENRMLGAYSTIDLGLHYASDKLSIGARLNNVLNKAYETFGTYGEVDEVLGDIYPTIESTEFIGLGRPRHVSAYIKYDF